MHKSWIVGGATLLSIFQAERGTGWIACSSFEQRTNLNGPRWPKVLSGLTAVEAALLQDVAWWGPVMESRLQQLAGVPIEPANPNHPAGGENSWYE